jgi:probable rRNA maturation factor
MGNHIISIDILNFQRDVRIPRQQIMTMYDRACRRLAIKQLNLSIVFLSASKMKALNKKSLGHNYVTDVITFNYAATSKIIDGEIVICPLQAKRQAREQGTSVTYEILLYAAHGLLHLCGYDDARPKDICQMRQMEEILLS